MCDMRLVYYAPISSTASAPSLSISVFRTMIPSRSRSGVARTATVWALAAG